MVPILALWMPILVAAVLVFAASSIVHMFLPYHRTDWKKVPNEDKFMDAVRSFNIPGGDYSVPCSGGPEELKSPEFREKARKGPVVFMTVLSPGDPFAMGSQLTQWFGYCVLIGVVAAYVAGRALAPGAEYLSVFRFTGAVAFAAYALALPQKSIWYRQSWSSTLKSMFDGFLYSLLTAGAFGWLWPNA